MTRLTSEEKLAKKRQRSLEYYYANREKSLQKAKNYRKNNTEKIKISKEKSRNKKPEYYRNRWRDYSQKNPHISQKSTRKFRLKSYGLTFEKWEELFNSQGRKCAIPSCGATSPGSRDWAIDHCHTTGTVRGILCLSCNVSLKERNTPQMLREMADYKEKYQ